MNDVVTKLDALIEDMKVLMMGSLGLTEDNLCVICGDIIEQDDVTGEVRCMNDHAILTTNQGGDKDLCQRLVK